MLDERCAGRGYFIYGDLRYRTAPLRTRKTINFNCYQLMMMTKRVKCGFMQSLCIFMMNFVKGIRISGQNHTHSIRFIASDHGPQYDRHHQN